MNFSNPIRKLLRCSAALLIVLAAVLPLFSAAAQDRPSETVPMTGRRSFDLLGSSELFEAEITISLEEIKSYRGYRDEDDLRDCLGWFGERSPHSINISDLVYRLQTHLKFQYELTQLELNGNILSGILFKAPGDGAVTGGSAEIDLDTARAVIRYEAGMEDYYATENLTLR